MCLTSFGDDSAGPPALPCSRGGALVGNGAAAPKSCLSPLEMHSPTATGGLLPTGKASTTTRITFYQPRFRFCPTEETNSERTSTQYALHYSSFWWKQLPAPSWRRFIQTNSRQLWHSIQAVLKVVYALARFWEHGTRCFVGRFSFWSGWWRLECFFDRRRSAEYHFSE